MRVLHFDITVGNVISEPTILCVILSIREETKYVCNSKARLRGAAYVGVQP